MTATRVYERFSEGPADGSSASGAIDQFSGSTQSGTVVETFSAADKLRGSYAYKIVTTAGQTFKGFTFPGGSATNSFHTIYMNWSAVPAAITTFAQIMSSSTIRAQLALNASGRLLTRSPSLQVGSAGTVVLAGVGWVRIEWDCTGTVQVARCYTGANLFSNTPAETLSPGASSITVSGHDRIRLGVMQNNYTGTTLYDEYAFDTDAAPGAVRQKNSRGWGLAV